MFHFTIHNNTFLQKDVLKSIAQPLDLAWANLFEPGAGCECGTPNLFQGIEGYFIPTNFLVWGPFVTELPFGSLPALKVLPNELIRVPLTRYCAWCRPRGWDPKKSFFRFFLNTMANFAENFKALGVKLWL